MAISLGDLLWAWIFDNKHQTRTWLISLVVSQVPMVWLEASQCFCSSGSGSVTFHQAPQQQKCNLVLRCTDHDRVFHQSSSRKKEKKLAKKGSAKHCFRKEKAYVKVSNNNITKSFNYRVRGQCTFSLRSQQREWIHSFWNDEVWLGGLPDLIFFFYTSFSSCLRTSIVTPLYCDLVFSLLKNVIKHYLHSFKWCKATLAFYRTPCMSC